MNTSQITAEFRLAHWAGIMKERVESGLSVKAFCREKGFHENIYFYWQKKLREAACVQLTAASPNLPAKAFTEVRISGLSETSPVTTMKESVCIETAGMRITAGNAYPASNLAELIRGLTAPC